MKEITVMRTTLKGTTVKRTAVHPVVTGLFLAVAILAGGRQVARAQEMPKPSADIQRLAFLAGTWEGNATVTMNGKTSHFRLRHENRSIAQGFGIECRETADSPEIGGRYESENLFGFDPGRGEIHLLTVTNWAETHDHKGKWADDKHFTMRYEGVADGKPMVEEIPVTIVSNNEYRFKSTVTIDGKIDSTFEADMIRQDQAKK